ncbi:hypothetical protein [Acidisoma cladoniae]|jgi:hypothetical protein|uniref:hypothetical protein n=1 Tax=Acidisoma cladoniae TaxID=3040935 RepID=UPI00254D48AB|nr:hypothetical protein [Acidisoma sp. PAMC 29798]
MSNRVLASLTMVRNEIWSVFVDDGVYAGSIVSWLAMVWLVLPRLGLAAPLPALVLFAGLAAILVWGSMRSARKR